MSIENPVDQSAHGLASNAEITTEVEKSFFRRHKLVSALGIGAVFIAGGVWYVSGQEKYAEDNCTDLEHVQVDVSAGKLSGIARFINRSWQPGSLEDVAKHTSEVRGYTISKEAVVELNPNFAQFADKDLKPGVACLSLPGPQTITGIINDATYPLVLRDKPNDLVNLTKQNDGSTDPAMVAAFASANADEWARQGFKALPDQGYYPPDTDFLGWLNAQPNITSDAMSRTKAQAKELGLIG